MHQQRRRWCTSLVFKLPSAFYRKPFIWGLIELGAVLVVRYNESMSIESQLLLWCLRQFTPPNKKNKNNNNNKAFEKQVISMNFTLWGGAAQRIYWQWTEHPKGSSKCVCLHMHKIWPFQLVSESKTLVLFIMIGELEATTQAGPHLTRIYLFGSKRRSFECCYLWPPPWTSKQPIYY